MNMQDVSNFDFRIEEYEGHFRVAKKKKITKYWYFLGLFPLFVQEVKYVWRVMLKDKNELSIRNCLQYDLYHFKTKEECIKWIDNYNKYPIYHYY